MTIRIALALVVLLGGCSLDVCAEHPPAFELGITVDEEITSPVASFDVLLEWDDQQFTRHYIVGDNLADGRTSIGVELSPAPIDEVDVRLTIVGRDGEAEDAPIVGRGRSRLEVAPNGCNAFQIEISPLGDQS